MSPPVREWLLFSSDLPRRLGFVGDQETAGLSLPQLGVDAAGGKQFVMRAFLDHVALVHDDQAVHRGDGGKAVAMAITVLPSMSR